jgi:hypothetical protein
MANSTWQEPAPTFEWEVIASGEDGPGPRSRHGLVYDQDANAAVLFGGIIWDSSGGLYQSDTWELRDGQWSRIRTSETPPARHRGAMVYLANRGQSLLFGGQGRPSGLRSLLDPILGNWNGLLADTWLYRDRQWQRMRPFGSAPSRRCGHCMTYDERAGVAVLFGGIDPSDKPLGDTWIFDGTHWERISGPGPSARRYAVFAYDPELQGCVLHGGAEDDRGHQTFGDAWLFREGGWQPLGDNFATDARDDHGLAYHRAAKRLVMLEGVAGARGILVREARGWRPVEGDPLHPRHQCSPLVWDEALGGLLLHGGEAHHAGPQFDSTLLLRMAPGS